MVLSDIGDDREGCHTWSPGMTKIFSDNVCRSSSIVCNIVKMYEQNVFIVEHNNQLSE